MNKTAIKNFAINARQKLKEDIIYKAELLGISEKGISDPLDISTDKIEFFDIGTGKPYEISGVEIKQRESLVRQILERKNSSDYNTAYNAVIEEVAYTWFNRLIAVRFMEVNDYLPSRTKVLSSENKDKSEPDIVTNPFDTGIEFIDTEKEKIFKLKDENKLDELFRMLFVKQCNELNKVLPNLFEKTSDYTELLLSISFTDRDGVLSSLVNDIEEEDFKEAVEIIGWLYQYYNTQPKEEVFAKLKKNVKITKENIPAATQLFTPDWIVKYMVENSLGRLWVEGHQNEELKSTWKYYLEEAEQEEKVIEQLETIRTGYKDKKLEEIKLIDPCMGSGHILVYAFEVFMQIYKSQGYIEREATSSIIKNNLFGLDIDERAYQLAYFAVMMKGRKYDRRFLSRDIQPELYCPKDYEEGQSFGSLIKVDNLEEKPQEPEVINLFNMDWEKDLDTWNFRRLLSQKYDVVITNPPYMGSKGMNAKLSDYVKKNYPDSKSDLFAVFIERCLELASKNAYTAMITQHAFMFLSSYEKLRAKLLNTDFINMAHLGARAFEEIGGEVVQTTSFVIRKSNVNEYKSTFARLIDYNSQESKENAFLEKQNLYTAKAENFAKIPGSPIAYWASENFTNNFLHKKISDYFIPKFGMSTGNGDLYTRLWYEVNICDITFKCKNDKDYIKINKTWNILDKGGMYKRWYGNKNNIVLWKNNGQEIKSNPKSAVRSPQYFFKPHVSWTLVSSSVFSARYFEEGYILDTASNCIYFENDKWLIVLGLLNSNVAKNILKILNPTINMSCGVVAMTPYIEQEKHIETINNTAKKNIKASKSDWDSFETSWDFKSSPLLGASNISDAYNAYKSEVEERFIQLKSNEEELNRIFIEIYGLEDELTPDVSDKDVTVARIYDDKNDIPDSIKGNKYVLTKQDVIKQFVSYAVGCMFGRYSLDVEGLAYAGGDWDSSKYISFIPDMDNCIPITDEDYFEDDIVGLFSNFVKAVYGESTLQDNLDFIADALATKGDTSRERIRNYFIKDFYKDHVKMYKKRPIYWLYDSGKANGFKALIYMHRYNADTTGTVRVSYLHKMQNTYTKEKERMQDTIDSSTNAREIAACEKRKEKLIKQLKETKEYDEKVAHIALSRIGIDLDDGVKVNYDKVQTGQDGKKFNILAKI